MTAPQKDKHELFVLFLFLRTPRLACDTSHGAFLRNSDSVRLTASKERRKRTAFADIERSGHSKQSKRDSVEPKAKCAARIVWRRRFTLANNIRPFRYYARFARYKSRQTASKERCKRTAFAEIVRSGHSKQIDTQCQCNARGTSAPICFA